MSTQQTETGESQKNPARRRIPLPSDVSVLPDERVLRVASFHWGIYWKGLAVLAIAVLLMLKVFNLGAFLMLVSGIMLGIAYMTKHYLLLILTDKRLLIRSGLIRMDTVQLALNRLESLELERTIPGMLMGYASVVITGTGSRVMAVPFVANAQQFRRLTDELVYSNSQKTNNNN